MLAAADAAGVAVAVLAVRGGRRFSFSLSYVFFVFSSTASSSSSMFSLLSPFLSSSLSFSRSPPSSVLSLGFFLLFFSAALPCIYRKTGEGERVGAATVGRPLHYLQRITTPGKWVSMVGVFLRKKTRKKVGEKWRKKNLLLPCSLRVQGRRRWCRFKTAPFWVLFFFFFLKNSA